MGPKTGQDRPRTKGFSQKLGLAAAICTLWPLSAWTAPITQMALDPFVSTVIAGGCAALAIASGLWAIAQHAAAERLRRAVRVSVARARAAVGERDALISAGQEALLVWGRDGSGPFSYGGGELLLESCLEGVDATVLSLALDDLGDKGSGFTLTAHDKNNKRFAVRGRAVGGMAAVWLREDAVASARLETPFLEMLNALPIPVWLRSKTLDLSWANDAYVAATGSRDLDTVRAQQTLLEKSERDLAASARAQGGTVETRRYATIGGQRRALSITEKALDDGSLLGSAIDVTDVASAETRLRQHADAHSDTLNKLATAVAVFDADQRLSFYNKAFAQLWDLPQSWLDRGGPTDGEILDRLRDAGKLPEQREYQSWKRQRLSYYESRTEDPSEEVWHLPGGKTLRVMAQRHPFGGLTFLYEDVTERFALESSYNTLSRVQAATLDTLQEGVAVFGADGRLKLYNAAFANIWEFSGTDLTGEPHIRRIAAACVEKFGGEAGWEQLIQSVVSGTVERHELGELTRVDQSILSLSLSTLPDGAILVTFADVTDRSRIENALRERNEALVAADKLKTDFVQHASFLFRDPLNVVRGFADLLAQGVAGALSERQSGYVQNILTASEKLEEVTSDILDLALIDAGAMRLELSRIDLYALLSGIAEPRKRHAESLDIDLLVDCPRDVGVIVADERRLKQVVFNLLTNAFEATPRGGTITLGGAIKGEEAQIWVADTGSGMAPEFQIKAFERFETKSKSGQLPGAGLGLALVRRFVELHDGWVEIESRQERGTVVRCHLPRRVYDETPPGMERRAG